MQKRLKKLLSMPGPERADLCAAALIVPLSKLALSLLPFSWLRRILLCWRPALTARPAAYSVDQVTWAVRAAAGLWHARCLPQALSAYILLRWHGWPAQLRIGVTKSASGQLLAHAWVESGGAIAIGDGADLAAFQLLLAIG